MWTEEWKLTLTLAKAPTGLNPFQWSRLLTLGSEYLVSKKNKQQLTTSYTLRANRRGLKNAQLPA
jgi:hypothetical protein